MLQNSSALTGFIFNVPKMCIPKIHIFTRKFSSIFHVLMCARLDATESLGPKTFQSRITNLCVWLEAKGILCGYYCIVCSRKWPVPEHSLCALRQCSFMHQSKDTLKRRIISNFGSQCEKKNVTVGTWLNLDSHSTTHPLATLTTHALAPTHFISRIHTNTRTCTWQRGASRSYAVNAYDQSHSSESQCNSSCRRFSSTVA